MESLIKVHGEPDLFVDLYGMTYRSAATPYGICYYPVSLQPPSQRLSPEDIIQANYHNALALIRLSGLETAAQEFGLTPRQLIEQYELPLPEPD